MVVGAALVMVVGACSFSHSEGPSQALGTGPSAVPDAGSTLRTVAAPTMRGAAPSVVPTPDPSVSPGVHGQSRQPPNVLFVFIDDARVDDMRAMPKTCRLIGGHGVRFVRAVSPNPLCCPARAELLSGQYTHNNGVLTNGSPDGGYYAFKDLRDNLGTWMQAAGYRSAYIGKQMNSYAHPDPDDHSRLDLSVMPGWTDWFVPVRYVYNYHKSLIDHNGRAELYPHEYKARLYAHHANQLIAQWSQKSSKTGTRTPWGMIISYLAPHPEYSHGHWHFPSGEAKYRGSLKGHMPQITDDAAIGDAYVAGKPAYIRAMQPFTRRERQQVLKDKRMRQEALRGVDDAIASNVAALKKAGVLQDTIVMVMSDNGYMLGEFGDPGGKIVPYRWSNMVPLLVRGPGFPAGVEVTKLVAIPDVTATIVDAMGLTPKRTLDGISLLKLIHHRKLGTHRPIELEAGHRLTPGWRTKNFHRSYVGIRTNRWQYVHYGNLHHQGRSYRGEQELYDMAHDPNQLHNLAHDPAYADIKAQLQQRLKTLKNCSGETCRQPLHLHR